MAGKNGFSMRAYHKEMRRKQARNASFKTFLISPLLKNIYYWKAEESSYLKAELDDAYTGGGDEKKKSEITSTFSD